MQSNRRQVDVSTGYLSYLSWGQGARVLCLHGLGDHALVWRSLGHALQDTHTCMAVDLPGHGDSYKPENPDAYLSPSIVSDLEFFAQAQGLSNLTVVAHSWSAKLALMWAKAYPQRIRRLILVDPFFVNRFPIVLKPTLPILYRVLPFLKMLGPFISLDRAESIAKTLKQYQGWSPWQQEIFQMSLEQKSDGGWGSKFTQYARNGVFLDTFQQSGLTEVMTLSTHIFLPEHGLNRRAWQLAPYKKYLPQATFSQVPGNHWPHIVAPEKFEQKVAEILASS